MNLNWDDYAPTWEQDTTTSQYADMAFRTLLQQTSITNKNILDFGCGTGLLSQRMSLQARTIVALDASEAMIEELDKKLLTNVEPVVDRLSRGLVAQHPAFRRQFDVIVASSVCGFVNNLTETLIIAHSLLEQDGLFIHWDWLKQTEDDHGLTPEQVKLHFKEAGFSDIECIPNAFELTTASGIIPVLMGIAKR